MDSAPREVYATLLNDGTYLCSWRTMYRLLARHDEVRERRNVRRHPAYVKPELAASAPNQVWTWDITYLKTEVRGQFFYLYVAIDLFSRYVVGWLLDTEESGLLARKLFAKSCQRQNVQPGQLTLHADRGAPMKSKTLKQFLSDRGVTSSHGRPRVSNDNPHSESGFKTMKYSPNFPARFSSLEEAEIFCRKYFIWYNNDHHHTGIALLTPEQVYHGKTVEALVQNQATLDAAFAENPVRFGNRRPMVETLPEMVWINRPAVAVSKPTEISVSAVD